MNYEIRIASPCSYEWNRMDGNDRVRYCPECRLNVFNFSGMSQAEIEALLGNRSDRICARFYQRPDGTMLTQNCPVGLHKAFRNASRAAASILSAILTLAPEISAAAPQQAQNAPLVQIKPTQAPLVLRVMDASGAPIANAKVALTGDATGNTLSAETDAQGELRLSGLTHAKYKLIISSTGFRTFTEEHVSLPAKTTPIYKLDVGALMGVIVIKDTRNPIHRFFSRLRHIV